MTIRPSVNLGDRIDFDLTGGPPPGVPYWLQGGPSDGTQVIVPFPVPDVIYAHDPGAEVALTPEAALPGVAVYERDRISATGGFHVYAYVRTDLIRQKKAKAAQ
jgi:hypothetical protein